jgi:hypothetical protein
MPPAFWHNAIYLLEVLHHAHMSRHQFALLAQPLRRFEGKLTINKLLANNMPSFRSRRHVDVMLRVVAFTMEARTDLEAKRRGAYYSYKYTVRRDDDHSAIGSICISVPLVH